MGGIFHSGLLIWHRCFLFYSASCGEQSCLQILYNDWLIVSDPGGNQRLRVLQLQPEGNPFQEIGLHGTSALFSRSSFITTLKCLCMTHSAKKQPSSTGVKLSSWRHFGECNVWFTPQFRRWQQRHLPDKKQLLLPLQVSLLLAVFFSLPAVANLS